MNWIFQPDFLPEETPSLQRHLNHYKITNTRPRPPWPSSDIYRGSIEWAKMMTGKDFKEYDCTHYYHRNPNTPWLNVEHIFLPWGEIKHQFGVIKRAFSWCDKLFIRPDSGCKEFTGTTIWANPKNIRAELEVIQRFPDNDITDDLLVMVAAGYETLGRECRVLCIKGKPVSWAYYAGEPEEGDEAAIHMLAATLDYYPEDIYTMDVCSLANGQLEYVVELNSFSCSGLYDMDYAKVVGAVENHYSKRVTLQ